MRNPSLLCILKRSRWVMQSKAHNESALEHLHMREHTYTDVHMYASYISHLSQFSLSLCRASAYVKPLLTICNEWGEGERIGNLTLRSLRALLSIFISISHFSLYLSLSLSLTLSLFLFQFLSVIYSHLSCDCFCWQFSFSLSNFSSDSFQPQPSLSCDLEGEREREREAKRGR